jgi:hypothetical protein
MHSSLHLNHDHHSLTWLINIIVIFITGVEITTRQLAKCEWNLELASNFFNLLASLASAFFPPLNESFFPTSAHCTNAQQRHDFGKFFSDLASKIFLTYSPVWQVP